MERPAAPVPPKPCRPILLEDPLFPRYKIRGVLAAGARRPLRFQSRRVGGRAGTAEPQGSGPCLPNPIQLGCGRDLGFTGEGSGGKPSRRRSLWKFEVSPTGAEDPGGWSRLPGRPPSLGDAADAELAANQRLEGAAPRHWCRAQLRFWPADPL